MFNKAKVMITTSIYLVFHSLFKNQMCLTFTFLRVHQSCPLLVNVLVQHPDILFSDADPNSKVPGFAVDNLVVLSKAFSTRFAENLNYVSVPML